MDNWKHMGKIKGSNFSGYSKSYRNGWQFFRIYRRNQEKDLKAESFCCNECKCKYDCLYWSIGSFILTKQEEEDWDVNPIDHMTKDLKTAFPEMSGFSPRKTFQTYRRWPNDYQCKPKNRYSLILFCVVF